MQTQIPIWKEAVRRGVKVAMGTDQSHRLLVGENMVELRFSGGVARYVSDGRDCRIHDPEPPNALSSRILERSRPAARRMCWWSMEIRSTTFGFSKSGTGCIS